jgi:tRNA-dihydrouridine synthase B
MPRIGPIELPEFPLLARPHGGRERPALPCAVQAARGRPDVHRVHQQRRPHPQGGQGAEEARHLRGRAPVGIQLFGGSEDAMEEAARIAEAAGPELIDINYGCPVHKVVSKGAGACLLQDVDKMVRLTEKVVKAVKLPVTVKTRLGWNDSDQEHHGGGRAPAGRGHPGLEHPWPHARPALQGPCRLDADRRGEEQPAHHIPIFGNGDIDSPEKAVEYRDRYGVDGIMIGRASIGHPWIFNEIKHFMATGDAPPTAHGGRSRGGRPPAPAQLARVEGAVGRRGGDAPPLWQLPQGPAQREGGAPAPVHRARTGEHRGSWMEILRRSAF